MTPHLAVTGSYAGYISLGTALSLPNKCASLPFCHDIPFRNAPRASFSRVYPSNSHHHPLPRVELHKPEARRALHPTLPKQMPPVGTPTIMASSDLLAFSLCSSCLRNPAGGQIKKFNCCSLSLDCAFPPLFSASGPSEMRALALRSPA